MGYRGSYSPFDDLFSMGVSSLFLFVIYLALAAIPISMLVGAAKKKGHYADRGTGGMWALGLFFTPIVLGLYVCALPDRLAHPVAGNSVAQSGNEELPEI